MRKVVRKVALEEQPSDFAYWGDQPYETWLAALEEIRREYHQHYGTERLQRVLRFVERVRLRYLMVGGFVVALHGHLRCTKDIGVWR